MLQLLYCLFLLIPVVAIPALLFLVSTGLGIAGTVVSVVLAVPLLIATYAHFDLLRSKSRYGLRDQELDEFSRLVPRLARSPEYRALPGRQRNRSTKRAAAEMIRQRRAEASGDGRSAEPARGRRRRQPQG
jgi:hypothetical protein